MASNNKWQKINGAENTISAVSQSHTRFAVGYIGLDGTPEYDAETRCWDFRVLMDVGDLGRITVFAQDKNSGPDTSRLVIDETTYSYGPVDYLTISSCGNPVFEKVAEQAEPKKTGKEMKNKIRGIIKNVASIPDDEVNYWAALSTFVILILGGICTLMCYFPALGGIVIFAALAPFIIINLIRRYWAPVLRCYSVVCMNLTGKPETYEVGVMAKDASAAAECAKKSLAEGRHVNAAVVNVIETNAI